nr:hypothetical protein [uncultured Pseudomonas sp.]
MKSPNRFSELRLAAAQRYFGDSAVTAFLTNVEITACCAVGVVHRHDRAGGGMFEDGHRIRTSDIHSVVQNGDYWLLLTASGSRYVIVTFKSPGGRQSLKHFLKVLTDGFYNTPHRLQ